MWDPCGTSPKRGNPFLQGQQETIIMVDSCIKGANLISDWVHSWANGLPSSGVQLGRWVSRAVIEGCVLSRPSLPSSFSFSHSLTLLSDCREARSSPTPWHFCFETKQLSLLKLRPQNNKAFSPLHCACQVCCHSNKNVTYTTTKPLLPTPWLLDSLLKGSPD